MQSPHTGKKIDLPVSEILKSIPEFFGVRANEEPDYDVLFKDGAVEVRRYHFLTTASVSLDADFESYRQEAFKRLAAYIFGENSTNTSLAMTAPVIQASSDKQTMAMTAPVLHQNQDRGWTMSFVLPKGITSSGAPKPMDPKIHLEDISKRTVAVLRYSGNNSEAKMREKTKKMQDWMASHLQFAALGKPFVAQYDAPFVLPFFKRNEVQIEVQSLDS